jgi:hypothetical protein
MSTYERCEKRRKGKIPLQCNPRGQEEGEDDVKVEVRPMLGMVFDWREFLGGEESAEDMKQLREHERMRAQNEGPKSIDTHFPFLYIHFVPKQVLIKAIVQCVTKTP